MTLTKLNPVPVSPPAPAPVQTTVMPIVPPVAAPARRQKRHRLVMLSFIALVILPTLATGYYLWNIAEDQFTSTVGFSVRREEVASPIEMIGGITDLAHSSSSDTDILYEFLSSQTMVERLDARLDLGAIWSKPKTDPIFVFSPGGTIEDLVDHWSRMVRISYDTSSKLIEIRVHAFTPDDAQTVAAAIYEESTVMINRLSDIARDDAVRYARDELVTALERLKAAREAVTHFRNLHQIVDPNVDIQTQAGLLGNLQSQLAEALISLDLLVETTRDSDPRIKQAKRRIEVIRNRISSEKRKLGIADDGTKAPDAFATVFGEYERLVVDREFAEQTYISALSAFDAAQAEARRQSRYLAAHIAPTLAERALYPRRALLLGMTALFLVLTWSIIVMIGGSIRDRR